MKKLIAYSSVAHMAIVTAGLFAFNQQGIEAAMMVMLGHGLVSGALFLCVGVIHDRLHTREISRYGGLSINMPRYAVLFLLFTMRSEEHTSELQSLMLLSNTVISLCVHTPNTSFLHHCSSSCMFILHCR